MRNPVSKTVTWLLIAIIVLLNFLYPAARTLTWDAFGYYLYLPLAFIYHDLGLENMDLVRELFEKYEPSTTLYQLYKSPEGGWVNRYSMGLALMNVPFFFIGHVIALLSDFPADGFSMPYQKAVWAGAMFYTIVALLMLRKVLLSFFSDRNTAMVLFLIVMGTNYLNYVSLKAQNILHVNYGFTCYVFILWFTLRWHRLHWMGDMILLAVFCGLNILSRPTEAVCLLIPLLWGVYNRESLLAKARLLFEKRKQVLAFALILVGIGSLQVAYLKLATGSYFFNPYSNNAGEGLDLLNPHTLKVLFSFRKGWLVYTPVMAFSLPGFVSLYRRNRKVFYAVLTYFLVNLYLVSSWSVWWYAYSYGQRALIPSYVILSLPLGYLLAGLEKVRWPLKTSLLALMLMLIGLNLFQNWQYVNDILHGSRMTRSYYFRIFGRTSVSEEDRKLLLVSRSEWPVEHVPDESEYRVSRLYFNSFTDESAPAIDSMRYHRMDPGSRFTPAFKAAFKDLTDRDHFYVRASADIFIPEGHRPEELLVVMSFEHEGKLYKYNTRGLDPGRMQYNTWNSIRMDYLSPHPRSKTDMLGVYLWYRGERYVLVRNMEILLFEPIQNRR